MRFVIKVRDKIMIRKVSKKISKDKKLKEFLDKYNIPNKYFSVNRKSTSKAVMIGLFIAFLPIPFQMIAVILLVPFVRFNLPIALAMCWITNPISMPFIYFAEYQIGSFLLNTPTIPLEMTFEWFSANVGNILLPLYTGALILSIFSSLFFYFFINYFWKHSVEKDKSLHFKNRD